MNDNIKIIKELKSLLIQELAEDVENVVLYGSQIKGKSNTENSDYDILIIVNKKYNWPERRKIRDLCYEIALKHDIIIDSKIISTQELNSNIIRNHPLYRNALNQGIYA